MTVKEAQEKAAAFNPEEYYTANAIDTAFGRIKGAAMRGNFMVTFTFEEEEAPYMYAALDQVEEAGFAYEAIDNTVTVKWGK